MALDTDKELLKDIIPYFYNKDFDLHFQKCTSHLSKSRRFLLKMELNRLYSPCSRTIDLRGRVDDTCREFIFNNQTHYLDPLAIEVFEHSISLYNTFTTGVYEDVTNTENSCR